ncbi:MAG TPA: hypothetical protein VN893_03210 [Bryobacteraceae bacterium]|nr:hypothetical protein [Bryobacteraceae bacterium]
MIIRQQQLEVFDRLSFQNFENEAVEHARNFAPKHCEVLGEDGTRVAVEAGIQRAGRFGFNSRGPVNLFIDLMFLLGSEFDSDPQYPWAGSIVRDRTIPGQAERADRLHRRSIEYLDKVYGPENRFAIAALHSVNRALENLARRLPGDFRSTMRSTLDTLYPQKSAELGDAGLSGVIDRGTSIAQSCSITSEAGIALLIALEFAFGHAFARDPLYPWIGATLRAESPPNANDRALLLYRKTMAYLAGVVSYLEGE